VPRETPGWRGRAPSSCSSRSTVRARSPSTPPPPPLGADRASHRPVVTIAGLGFPDLGFPVVGLGFAWGGDVRVRPRRPQTTTHALGDLEPPLSVRVSFSFRFVFPVRFLFFLFFYFSLLFLSLSLSLSLSLVRRFADRSPPSGSSPPSFAPVSRRVRSFEALAPRSRGGCRSRSCSCSCSCSCSRSRLRSCSPPPPPTLGHWGWARDGRPRAPSRFVFPFRFVLFCFVFRFVLLSFIFLIFFSLSSVVLLTVLPP
jgi:hypothetical protein